MRRIIFLKNPIVFVALFISVCCLLITIISVAKLPVPDVPLERGSGRLGHSYLMTNENKHRKVRKGQDIGKFGEMMIAMLPEDLAFTIFMPTEHAFVRDLNLRANDSMVGERRSDTYAVVSRILAFSAVPRSILSGDIRSGEEVSFDSVSGFRLYISRDDADGMLVVNRVRAKAIDLRKGEIVVHIMDGVIMDAEFEQSVRPIDGEEDVD